MAKAQKNTKKEGLINDTSSEKEPKQESLMDEISDKVEEGKKTDKANKSLAEENEIPTEDGSKKGEKALSAIGYILFFCILPLVLKRKSKFCQFHGKQGLVMTIFYLILNLFVFWSYALNVIISFAYLVGVIVGIVYSVQGKIIRIPGIEKIVDKLDFD